MKRTSADTLPRAGKRLAVSLLWDCNQRCSFCAKGPPPPGIKSRLSFGEAEKVLHAGRQRAKQERIAVAEQNLAALAQERQRLRWYADKLEEQLANLGRSLVANSGNRIQLINDPLADGLVTEEGARLLRC